MLEAEAQEHAWLDDQFEDWTTEVQTISPSEWAERNRELPPHASSLPGQFSWDVTPYLREIVDCMGPESPVREVSVKKGSQIGATTAVGENIVGYYIEHVKTAPMMYVTADKELADARIEQYIIPMLESAGLTDLIQSTDSTSSHKTGKTKSKIQWQGGGFLMPFGAQNPNKFRQNSFQVLIRDETDGWPLKVKDGDPMTLTLKRTDGYEETRKILNLSTPKFRGASHIDTRYRAGDQRQYFVACKHCNFPQVIRFEHDRHNSDTGAEKGFTWELEHGYLLHESVRYRCIECGGEHTNDDKIRLLDPNEGAHWRATARPTSAFHRSYHVPALLAPVGMHSWASVVEAYLEAYDPVAKKYKDLGKLQVFYNNELGETYELRGTKVRFEHVSAHRRQEYSYGEIPNTYIEKHCESPILVVTGAVDIGKDNLKLATVGWTRRKRAWLIDYQTLEGNTENLEDPNTWGALDEILEHKTYVADDGKDYSIPLTLIDSGYRTERAYEFCDQYDIGVYPIKGVPKENDVARVPDWQETTNKLGQKAFRITVDNYKERWAASLRWEWGGVGLQPAGHFNAPGDVTTAQLKELTAEIWREKIEDRTGKRIGMEWYRPSHARNELWDLLVYNAAALDLLAWTVCRQQFDLPVVNWETFYTVMERKHLYFR